MTKPITASILSIGDELLIGQVINTNAAWLSDELLKSGISVIHHLSVADTKQAIIEGLTSLRQNANVVLVTGGLGPTKDDITISAISEYFNDKLIFHEETYERLGKIMRRFGRQLTENQKQQCYLPKSAMILKNDMGSAPGMYFLREDVHYFFMPGVPFEMQHLFSDRFIPILKDTALISDNISSTTILTAGLGESALEEEISDIVSDFPDGLSIAYLPGKAQVRLRLTGNGISGQDLSTSKNRIINRLGKGVFGFEDETLEMAVGKMALENNWTMGFAESCTGGAVSAKITTVPGASRYFRGSIIAYDNDIKHRILNISNHVLENAGAVSKDCVHAMVENALNVLDVDLAVAISGIAGPGGGTEDKPVGTVFIGVGDKHIVKVKRLVGTKSRAINIEYFTSYALNLLRLFMLDKAKVARGQ